MSAALARLVMILAIRCLGEARRDWALAMEGEFEAALEAREPLGFAFGCLIAAFREMPRHTQGRYALANHGLALGLLIPVAGLQLLCAAAAIFPDNSFHGAPVPGSAQARFFADAYMAAVPLLLSLWLFLCVLHLRLAWLVLERDWPGIIRIGSLVAACTVTLLIFCGVLMIDDSRPILQTSILAIEIGTLAALARWHARLIDPPTADRLAW